MRIERLDTSYTDSILRKPKSYYELGDISRAVNVRRKEWMRDFLGEDATANYEQGDSSKKYATNLAGKDDD